MLEAKRLQIRKKFRSLSPLLLIAAVWFAASICLVAVDFWHRGADEHARQRFSQIRDAENRVAVERVNNVLSDFYQQLRTVARLPGVRRIGRHAENFESDSRSTTQEIYNLLRAKLAVSELCIVPIDLNPDTLDPVTGKSQTPIAQFDSFIVNNRVESKGSLSRMPEVNIYEYRQMRAQAKYFQDHFPTDVNIHALGYPAISGPEVITGDNSRYSSLRPDDADRSGLVYSVPVYDEAGKLHAMVSGTILTSVLADLLPNGDMALFSKKWNTMISKKASGLAAENIEYIRALKTLPESPFSRVGRLKFPDQEADWRYWVAAKAAAYTDSHDNEELQRFTGLLVLFVLTIALFITLLIAASIRTRERLEDENMELEKIVQSRTADLLRARRLEAIGEMAAGIAHEINTPTQFVGDNLSFLRRSCETAAETWGTLCKQAATTSDMTKVKDFFKSAEAKKTHKRMQESVAAIDDSLEGVNRIRDIVRSLREFAHPGIQGRELANINRIVENAVTVTRNEWKNVARVDLRLTESLDAAKCSPGEIGQVLVNLLVNASHAIKGSGRSVDTGLIKITTGRCDDYLEVRVYDNGCGISEDHKRRVWDQYFTTKAVGIGTGMGLAIVRNIVERHHGEINLESELGCWTEFVLRLPYILPIDDAQEDMDQAA